MTNIEYKLKLLHYFQGQFLKNTAGFPVEPKKKQKEAKDRLENIFLSAD